MKKIILLITICFLMSVISNAQTAKRGRCLLEVNGKKYISGACKIEMDKDGSFRIYDLKKRGFFAYVNMADVGAVGYWNGPNRDSHAHENLGELFRNGGCWEGENAKVCAWR
ncbi:MAG: hypothetical protein ACK5NT_14545 [Pyrinomonadaceae bacterium]